jgi:hypothetical protein
MYENLKSLHTIKYHIINAARVVCTSYLFHDSVSLFLLFINIWKWNLNKIYTLRYKQQILVNVQPIYTDYANWTYFNKISHLNLLLWDCCTNLSKIWSFRGPFQNCVWQLRTPFKMVSINKNRNFFNCLLLLYEKSKFSYMALGSSTYIPGISVKFFFNQFI